MRTTAIVTEIQSLAPSVLQLTVSFNDDFSFQPGQWVNFRFPEGVSRAYTIASAPERPEAVQLCVRVGPGKGGEAVRKVRARQPRADGRCIVGSTGAGKIVRAGSAAALPDALRDFANAWVHEISSRA